MSDSPVGIVAAIEERRAAEKAQALFYRALAAAAEEAGDERLAQRLHDLHADEQHHLSRLTARLLELGAVPADLGAMRASGPGLAGWEISARERERAEIEGYETLLRSELDDRTRALAGDILDVERHHEQELGGKWTLA
jgi:rubrerythrin